MRGFARGLQAAVITTLVSVSVGALLGAPDLPEPSPVPVSDYVRYWAASRVNLAGGNPYDFHDLLAAQRVADPSLWTRSMMWNPPWTLSLTMLPSLIPYPESRTIWMVLNCLILTGASGFLWTYWAGTPKGSVLAATLASAFPASFFALVIGQLSPIMLLGVAGFLYFERKQRLGWAGAAAALTLVKPQVVYLFWVVLLLWAVFGRRWRVLGGAFAALVALSAAPFAANPKVFSQYLTAVLEHSPNYFVTPTIGTMLRMLFGWDRAWLMVIPAFAGLAWLLRHWSVHWRNWEWSAQISMVLLVSVVTSPYAWLFDQVVLLLPALQIAVVHGSRPSRRTRRALAVYGAAILGAFVMLPWNVNVRDIAGAPQGLLREALTTPNMFWHVTIAPLFLAGFLNVSGAGDQSARAPR